ncbi:carbonic anhydrase [Neorhizobium galegae]|uniref:Carbonic anhydrase n=1 Tax=Neorhizobium galegae TaxID=399 RepID=A0A6A1TJU8_NEOGA|nr:carbonic anhydrase [Neorhizobium galegae]KAB1083176.1 carbonic anhydrase [Neorhizobium galegae]
MCIACFNRRSFFGLAAAALALPTMAIANESEQAGPTPAEALAKLKEGNARFISSPELCELDMQEHRNTVAKGQHPFATILTCADSRVSPELLFGGVGLGDLFVCRNAGNVADVSALGSIEYAVEHLHCPLIVVMGHERCGAVGAAVSVVNDKAELPGFIKPMIDAIVPAVEAVKPQGGDTLNLAVLENAKRNASRILTESKIVAEHVEAGKVMVVYARYDLDDGIVEFIA